MDDRAREKHAGDLRSKHLAPDDAWSQSIERGVRANDLSGKAGEIAAQLEERLVRGKYRFGEALSIYNLADQFDASRQPVATAVLYLRCIGYLEIIPQVGCRVVSPSAQEVQDFHFMFSRTEAVIAHFASERYQENEADAIVALAEELAANPFQSKSDRRAMANGIATFHYRISAMARSPVLLDRISNLRRIFRFYLCAKRVRPDPAGGPPERMNQLRLDLAKAIYSRDSTKAERLTEQYIFGAIADWARVV